MKTIRAPCYRKAIVYFYFTSPLLAYSPLAKPARVPLTQLIPYLFTHTHIRTHTFTIVSLLFTLVADLCLPLSAGEDTFELHSVQLEAVERQIHKLLEKQAQLMKWKAMLETSRADIHKSWVSMQRAAITPTTSTPCVSLHRPCAPGTRSSQISFTPAPGNPGP